MLNGEYGLYALAVLFIVNAVALAILWQGDKIKQTWGTIRTYLGSLHVERDQFVVVREELRLSTAYIERLETYVDELNTTVGIMTKELDSKAHYIKSMNNQTDLVYALGVQLEAAKKEARSCLDTIHEQQQKIQVLEVSAQISKDHYTHELEKHLKSKKKTAPKTIKLMNAQDALAHMFGAPSIPTQRRKKHK